MHSIVKLSSKIESAGQVFLTVTVSIFIEQKIFDQHLRFQRKNSLNKSQIREKDAFPVGMYLLKVKNRNTRAKCEIWSKLTIKTPELLLPLNTFHTLL